MTTQNTVLPGQRVRITQSVPRQSGAMSIVVEGTVISAGAGKTGSWFAHGKDNKVWLDRIQLKKDDGELVVCNMDPNTRVELLN